MENYLKNKYNSSSAPFTALPSVQTSSNSVQDDGLWKHSYNSSNTTKLIASVKDFCLNLGTRSDVVYTDATAGAYNGKRYMRRHYVIKPSLNPAGAKRVRLFYTNADFADLQTYVPSLTSASQLVVTQYSGANEDGVYDPTGGTLTFIPSSQITTGTLYGNNYLEFNVTGFSEFWIHTGTTTLPLQFINITATKKVNTIEVSWKTAAEVDVNNFEVQRSTDGLQFKTVATVPAKNQLQNSYMITDVKDESALYYYRVKQVDNNGVYKYSSTVKVNFGKTIDVTIAPNPAKNWVSIRTSSTVKTLQLLNTNGQIIKTWKPEAGQQYNIAGISSGVYLLRLVTDTDQQIEKLIVE